MERDLSGREAGAALLLLAAAAHWAWLGVQEPLPARTVAWLLGALMLLVGAWGVVRGLARLREAVRRSAAMLAVVLVVAMAVPLPASGDSAPFEQRLAALAAPLLGSVAVAALLWRLPPSPAPEPSASPPAADGQRRRRKRRRRRREG